MMPLRPWLDRHTVQHKLDSGERTATRLSDEPGLHQERCGG